MNIKYISTRGQAPELSFEEVVIAGLASDGGLYLPTKLPSFSAAEIAGMSGLSYPELAARILTPFTKNTLTDQELKSLLEQAYGTFRHAAIAPVKQLDKNHFLLELFHGPTLAFKDFALQFLGLLLDHILKKRGEKVVIVGATSGDTGSAAISGCRGRDNITLFILHPHGRVSEVQRRQMTTVKDTNVFNIALKGTFDDCQDTVKALFADAEFKKKHHLVAVNSINWARIVAQTVYYFYAALALGAPARAVSFSVPTGNFGDIYAGYIAKRMGLPIDRLIIATNRNDILTRTLQTGAYTGAGVTPTLSPSMDIQVSSNFERLLFDLHGRDGAQLNQLMQDFKKTGKITLAPQVFAALKSEFDAFAVDDEETKQTIKRLYETTGELLDPHTAVGVRAAEQCKGAAHVPVVTLSTAHPAKFPDAVKSCTGIHPALPPHMAGLFDLPEKYEVIDNKIENIRSFIEKSV